MNENIDLTKILKYCPRGTKFYSLVHGEVTFVGINEMSKDYPIEIILTGGLIYKKLNQEKFYIFSVKYKLVLIL